MSKRYIDAEKFAYRYKCLEQVARNNLAKTDPTSPEYQKYLTQIQERIDVQRDTAYFPEADVQEIIRCKDCKYNASSNKCINPDSFFLIPKDDDYCSYAERR